MKETIGIIGFGNMGSAIAERLRSDFAVLCFDKEKTKTSVLARGITASVSVEALARGVKVVILAVKPADFDGLLNEIKDAVQGRLVVSIAAGITTAYIEEKLGRARVTRAMPNLPARIGLGITGIAAGKSAAKEDLAFTRFLFEHLGKTLVVNENMLNALTAVSGNGPAYTCNFLIQEGLEVNLIPAHKQGEFSGHLAKAAERIGFCAKDAQLLAQATVSGTVAYLKQTGIAPQELIKQVMSKGGSTEAAFGVLNSGGSLEDAVKAGLRRAEELSRR